MILREHYLEKIRPFYDGDLIKIITGIRRCGKSPESVKKIGKRTGLKLKNLLSRSTL